MGVDITHCLKTWAYHIESIEIQYFIFFSRLFFSTKLLLFLTFIPAKYRKHNTNNKVMHWKNGFMSIGVDSRKKKTNFFYFILFLQHFFLLHPLFDFSFYCSSIYYFSINFSLSVFVSSRKKKLNKKVFRLLLLLFSDL